ncbi:MAG: EamA family transporter [Anaerolineales bacterium]|jgi:drug/metabolite transporter (DMT)-like permease|uniref:DMT family transporter n=1 Tax=Candidatus Villigracilis affinis TaxID=3140682 RepID=UPI001B4436EE|nr:EamA family transporter [Anaerolineales bacterium]MBL0343805.1 EamA family transporter [Anaerolineales bacterium]MBP8047986.1 EamA family transporter [Anaerolineales bacterium]
MDSLSERRKAILFLALAAILWSTSGLFIKILDWQPLSILAARSFFAAIVFLIYLRRIPTRFSMWQLLAAGMFILTQFLFITSTKLTTAANAIFLQYTAPIYVVLLAFWFLREKPSRTDWLSMLIIFLGLTLFFGDKLSTDGFYGNLLAILSGVTSAVMMVSFRAQKNGNPAESNLIAFLVTAAFGIPFVLKETWTVESWSILAFLGVFQIGLAFIFFTQGIKHIPALEANLIGTLEPVLNPIWVFLFYGESMGAFALIGGLVVLGGVVLSAVGGAKAAKEEQQA